MTDDWISRLASDDPVCWEKLAEDQAMLTGLCPRRLYDDFFDAYKDRMTTTKRPREVDFATWRYSMRIDAWREVTPFISG